MLFGVLDRATFVPAARCDEDILQTVIKKQMAPPHVKTVLGALIFYGWHEAYHMGTMAMIRATLNYPETSKRIMESFRK